MRIKDPQKHCSIFAREEKVNIISRNLYKEHLHTSKVTHSVCVYTPYTEYYRYKYV